MSIAERIRTARKSAMISLDKLSLLSGISRTYLWELEKDIDGEKHPSVDVLGKIARALGVTLSDLAEQPLDDHGPRHIRHRIVAYVSLDQLVETLEQAVEHAKAPQLSRYVQERLEDATKNVREKLDAEYGVDQT